FAQLSEKANPREAIGAYDSAAKAFASTKRTQEEFVAVRRLTALDPSPETIAREGDLAAQLNERDHAAACFFKLGQMLERGGRSGFAWYERAYGQAPEDEAVAYFYAKELMNKGDSSNVARVLEPFANQPGITDEVRELYARVLMAEKRPAEAR